jgi:hydroxymethylbilane synthase
LRLRGDLRFVDMRGNVDTRVGKVRNGEVDALILAMAGLSRLGLGADLIHPLPMDVCLPAPGQGALGIEARADAADVLRLLIPLDDARVRAEVVAERAVLAALDAGCLVPLAALARMRDQTLRVEALVASPDGKRILREAVAGPAADAEGLGKGLAAALQARGAAAILAEARRLRGGAGDHVQ